MIHVTIPRHHTTAAPIASPSKPARWRVEKALAARGGYGLGWFAMCTTTNVGVFKPTWREAMDHAIAQTTSPMEACS